MNKDQLKKIVVVGLPAENILDEIIFALNQTFVKYQINTPLRQCHFLAQVMHESGVFKYKEEIWGNTPAQLGYDTRVDLGNTPEKDGDGKLYKGRGWIQLTGKANYEAFSKFLNKPEIMTNPDLVSTDYSFESAIFFFEKNKLWEICDKGVNKDTILTLTKRINGGTHGLEDREAKTMKYYGYLGK